MDDPRQDKTESEKPLKHEVFDPPFAITEQEALETAMFTVGKEYPIYEEKLISSLYYMGTTKNRAFKGIQYRTINDDGEMVCIDSIYFYLKGNIWNRYEHMMEKDLPVATFNLREEYKKLTNHMPFEEYMAMLPVWRVLSGLPETLNLTKQLKELDKELGELKGLSSILQRRVRELLRRDHTNG
ncbi:MAG: hypothetical protein M0R80_08640 [Proteobacteria bacterium]|jgi:hypothetical protein|nr:hypothetical protein [Pseudomonadota bacterium]